MTDIVLVRHGETEYADERYAGAVDVPLSKRGNEQAREFAKWATSAGLTAAWSSDMHRTRDTAQPAAAAAKVELNIDPRLREVDFGDVEGMTRADIERSIPDVFAAFKADPVANPMPGGEDPREATARGLSCLREISAAHPNGRVLVVCHTTLIRLMFCSLVGVSLSEYRRLLPAVHNCFLNEIRLAAGRVSILSWNAPPNDHRKTEDL